MFKDYCGLSYRHVQRVQEIFYCCKHTRRYIYTLGTTKIAYGFKIFNLYFVIATIFGLPDVIQIL